MSHYLDEPSEPESLLCLRLNIAKYHLKRSIAFFQSASKRAWVVLGSAPNPTLPHGLFTNGVRKLACVNGSGWQPYNFSYQCQV